eukprot:40503-Eustigmatos_ZCMA.PRE.1
MGAPISPWSGGSVHGWGDVDRRRYQDNKLDIGQPMSWQLFVRQQVLVGGLVSERNLQQYHCMRAGWTSRTGLPCIRIATDR